MDNNYDDHCITFIASKCDDISCSEVISALGLHGDPELEAIEERIDEFQEQITEKKKKKTEAEKIIKSKTRSVASTSSCSNVLLQPLRQISKTFGIVLRTTRSTWRL